MKIHRAFEILEQAEQAPDFLVAPILPRVGLSIWAGSPGCGKSSLIRGLAVALSTGAPSWLGLELGKERSKALREVGVPPGSLLIHLEESRASVFRHLKELGLTDEAELAVLDMDDVSDAGFKLDPVLSQVRPALVVVDTMAELLGLQEINSYTQTVAALQEFRVLSERHQTHFAFIHHAPKQDTSDENAILGSTGIRASVDTAMVYRKLPRTGTRVLSCSKVRVGQEILPLAVGLDPVTKQSVAIGSAEEARARENCAWFADILRAEDRQMSKGDLSQATGLPMTEVWKSIHLDPDGVLERVSGRTSAKYTLAALPLAGKDEDPVPF